VRILGAVFSGKASTEVLLFTGVEFVTLTFWLTTFLAHQFILSAGILAAGLLVEHFISAATGINVTKA